MTASPEIEVFYDGHCPICKWEIKLYSRMDKAGLIKWTAVESLLPQDLPDGKTEEDLLRRFHVKDLNEAENIEKHPLVWFIGVDAFARIWRVLPALRNFAGLFSFPGIRQLTMVGYKVFLKWQSWHRSRR